MFKAGFHQRISRHKQGQVDVDDWHLLLEIFQTNGPNYQYLFLVVGGGGY